MNDIQAVTEGAKTGLMKKMYQRADAGGSIFERMIGMRPHELELTRAFSIIVKERTIDFVASTSAERDAWLQHLNILLVHQRSFDTEKVITRKDVVEELHMMSFQIGKLLKQRAKASESVLRASVTDTLGRCELKLLARRSSAPPLGLRGVAVGDASFRMTNVIERGSSLVFTPIK